MNNQLSLHPQYHDLGALEQGTGPQLLPECPALAAHCSGFVFTAVYVHFAGLNEEHKLRVWVTIIGHTSLHFHLI